MAQDLSIEDRDAVFFCTTRTAESRLWFVNSPLLTERILAYLAKYAFDYSVVLYAFELMGNHYHLLAGFPLGNKSAFLRSFNSMVARLVKSYVKTFGGGKLWARRARTQFVLEDEDVENWFYYAALNPIASGLGQKYSDYPGYSSFSDAISGRVRKFKVVNWSDYRNRKRYNKKLTIEDCTQTYELKFHRLPGYEKASAKEYREVMLKKFEGRRQAILKERKEKGLGYASPEQLRKTEPGTKPRTTKTSTRHTRRPLCLTLSRAAKERFLTWYFDLLAEYKEASRRFRRGELTVTFPPGTYRPPAFAGFT